MNDHQELPSQSSSRPTYVRYSVLALISSAAASLYLTRHCLAVTNEEIQQELGFGSTEMGAVMGLFSLGYLIFQVPGGWLGNKIGTRWGLATISIVWSVLTFAMASAHGLFPLKVARFLFGAAQAGFVPITAKIVKDWCPEKKLGIASAFVGVSMSIGGALALDVTGRLTSSYDWRFIFQMYALVGIVWSIVFLLLFRNTPEQHPRVNASEVQLIRAGATANEHAPNLKKDRFFTLANVLVLLGSVNLWAICIQSFFRAAGYNFFVTFFPEFLTKKFENVDAAQAGVYSKWPLIGVVIGGLIGGFVVDRILARTGNRWLSRSLVAAISLLLTAGFTFVSFYATTAGGFVVLIAVGAALSGCASPVAWAATIDVGGRHTSVVAGVMNMAGCISGVLVTPILGGMMDILKGKASEVSVEVIGLSFTMSDQWITDWSQVIYMHAAFYVLAGFFWLFVKPSKTLLDTRE